MDPRREQSPPGRCLSANMHLPTRMAGGCRATRVGRVCTQWLGEAPLFGAEGLQKHLITYRGGTTLRKPRTKAWDFPSHSFGARKPSDFGLDTLCKRFLLWRTTQKRITGSHSLLGPRGPVDLRPPTPQQVRDEPGRALVPCHRVSPSQKRVLTHVCLLGMPLALRRQIPALCLAPYPPCSPLSGTWIRHLRGLTDLQWEQSGGRGQ